MSLPPQVFACQISAVDASSSPSYITGAECFGKAQYAKALTHFNNAANPKNEESKVESESATSSSTIHIIRSRPSTPPSHAVHDYSHLNTQQRALMSAANTGAGACLIELGQSEAAAHHLYSAIDILDNNHVAFFNLGVLHERHAELELSVKSYKQAIKRAPEQVSYHINLGAVYALQNEYNRALTSYKAAVELAPKSAIAVYNFACGCIDKGKWEEAVTYMRQCIQLDANTAKLRLQISQNSFAVYYSQLALCLLQTQAHDAAIYYATLCIGLDPTIPHAHRHRAYAAAALNIYPMALSDAATALHLLTPDTINTAADSKWPKTDTLRNELTASAKEWRLLSISAGEEKSRLALLNGIRSLSVQSVPLNVHQTALVTARQHEAAAVKAAISDQSSSQSALIESAQTKGRADGKREALLCLICCDATRSVLFEPCKHLLCCTLCAVQVRTCPVCKIKIDKRREPIYF